MRPLRFGVSDLVYAVVDHSRETWSFDNMPQNFKEVFWYSGLARGAHDIRLVVCSKESTPLFFLDSRREADAASQYLSLGWMSSASVQALVHTGSQLIDLGRLGLTSKLVASWRAVTCDDVVTGTGSLTSAQDSLCAYTKLVRNLTTFSLRAGHAQFVSDELGRITRQSTFVWPRLKEQFNATNLAKAVLETATPKYLHAFTAPQLEQGLRLLLTSVVPEID